MSPEQGSDDLQPTSRSRAMAHGDLENLESFSRHYEPGFAESCRLKQVVLERVQKRAIESSNSAPSQENSGEERRSSKRNRQACP